MIASAQGYDKVVKLLKAHSAMLSSKKDREQAVQYRLIHGKNRCFNSQCKKVEDTLGDYSSCSACKSVFYCSRECQKGDWKMHKKVCQSLKSQK